MRDPVTPEVREAVMARDKRCVVSIYDLSHTCFDVWGHEHASDDIDRLTLEHVKSQLGMGRRAPSDMLHLVAMCGWVNVILHPTKAQRQWIRAYLAAFVPKEDAA